MRKKVLTINMSLEYPLYRKFKKYKRGQPRPKYSAKDKRAPLIQYDKKSRGCHERTTLVVENPNARGSMKWMG